MPCFSFRRGAHVIQTMKLSNYNPDDVREAMERREYALVLSLALAHASLGNSDAQTTVALLYECGLGVQRNVREAERWLVKAIKQNNAVAWNNLGTLYASRLPELRSRWEDATACYEKARELGLNVADPYPPSVS